MKRSLKLKKIKISKINNIMAGALPAQNAANNSYPIPITDDGYCADTKLDGDCKPQTNGNRTSRTAVPAEPVNSGIQN